MKYRNAKLMLVIGVFVAAFATSLPGGAVTASAQSRADAKSLYKSAHEQLNKEQYDRAAELFREVYRKYDDSSYAGDAMYWYAFSLYRAGGRSNLREATRALETQMEKYDDADTENDAGALYYRILGERARAGDADAASKLQEAKEDLGDVDDDMETKLMAMEALLNMREDRALPILKQVMSDRRPQANKLREKAVFLLSQHQTHESTALLIDAAKSDPNPTVREQAVFWLSQVDSDEAMDYLLDAVTSEEDPEIRKKAVFAISQRGGERAAKVLQTIALDRKAEPEVREQAIFWIGQMDGPTDTQFLIDLYAQLDDEELKNKTIFSVSQREDAASAKWLLKVSNDRNESIDMRKQALFWAGESGALDVNELVKIYKNSKEPEFQEQVIFVLSQRGTRESMDVMMKLAREEKDPQLRKKLIFWIGQSDDPRAVEFLTDIINN